MTGLKRQLGFWEGVALSVGIMAPTAAMALNGALAASIAGASVGLAFLGALVTIILVSYSFIEFSRQYATLDPSTSSTASRLAREWDSCPGGLCY
jgi:amino acid transporter